MTIAFDIDRLRAIAEEKYGDTSVSDIADRVGIDRGSVSRYLKKTRKPDLIRIHLFAKTYEVDPSELLSESAA